jgi:hypothetical protein
MLNCCLGSFFFEDPVSVFDFKKLAIPAIPVACKPVLNKIVIKKLLLFDFIVVVCLLF